MRILFTLFFLITFSYSIEVGEIYVHKYNDSIKYEITSVDSSNVGFNYFVDDVYAGTNPSYSVSRFEGFSDLIYSPPAESASSILSSLSLDAHIIEILASLMLIALASLWVLKRIIYFMGEKR